MKIQHYRASFARTENIGLIALIRHKDMMKSVTAQQILTYIMREGIATAILQNDLIGQSEPADTKVYAETEKKPKTSS